MDLTVVSSRWQRLTILTLVVLTTVAFWTNAPDAFALPKATLLWVGAIVLVALSAVRAAWARELLVPRSPWALAVVALVVAIAIATLASETLALSIVGEYTRYTGLLSYAAFAVVGLTVLRTFDVDEAAMLLRVLTVLLVAVGLYGLLQVLDMDPYEFGVLDLGSVGTLGNANIFAGFLAVAVPGAVWQALTATAGREWRMVGAGAAVLGVVVAIGTRSFQGPAAALPGALVVLIVWATTEDGRRARDAAVARVGARVLAAAGVVIALVGAGVAANATREGLRSGFVERGDFWRSALTMFGDGPILGVGFDTYSHHFLAARPSGHASAFAVTQAESAHSVPLNLLAGGGLLVALAWLALVALTGVALVRGLRRLDGEERLLLGGLGGAWVAYLIQSTVSFDVPALGLLHLALAGSIVAIGTPPHWRTVGLPGSAPRARGRKGQETFDVPSATYVALAAIAVVAVVGVWSATRPLRADLAAAHAQNQNDDGDAAGATSSLKRATELAPWQGRYWLLRAQLAEARQEVFDAVTFAENAARRDPGNPQYAVLAGRLNARYRDDDAARPWLEDALRRDPRNPNVRYEVATLFVDVDAERAVEEFEATKVLGADLGWEYAKALALIDRDADAEKLLDELLAAAPDDPAGLLRAGEVALAIEDEDRALDIYRHAAEVGGATDYKVQVATGLEQVGAIDEAIELLEPFQYWGDAEVDAALARLREAEAATG